MSINWAKWFMPIVLALRSPKEEGTHRLEVSLGHTVRPCLKGGKKRLQVKPRCGHRIPDVAHASNFCFSLIRPLAFV